MSKPVRSRRIVALAAAYVVALQALLLPLSVAAGASFDSSRCVTASTADGSQPPVSHETGCACAAGCGMQCCGQALAGPPQTGIALRITRAIVQTPTLYTEPVEKPADKGPQIPRAPPAA